MPYIVKEARKEIDNGKVLPRTSGELNYNFSILCKDYLEKHGTSYKTMNDIVGALESCKLEFYRRIVVPYENTKIETNGDVY